MLTLDTIRKAPKALLHDHLAHLMTEESGRAVGPLDFVLTEDMLKTKD